MNRKYLFLVLIVVPLVLLDQWTKFVVLKELTVAFDDAASTASQLKVFFGKAPEAPEFGLHYQQKRFVTVSEEYFRIRYAENPGAAWGLFRNLSPEVRGPLFHVVSLGALVLIAFFMRELTGKNRKEIWALMGLPLVLSGAIGNYIDRLARGFVIDFLEFHWHDQVAWPSFNVADIAISVGVGMLLIDSFVRREKKEKLS